MSARGSGGPGRVRLDFRKLATTAAVLVTILGIGWIDYVTGPDIAFSLFYLLPIIAAGWWLGRASAGAAAVAASIVWFLADVAWRPREMIAVSAWNGFTRFGIFLLIGLLTNRVRRDRDRLAQLDERLKELLENEAALARTDALTKLPNRRSFRERLGEEVERSRRGTKPLCVAYIDIDHFKRVNDMHGHAAGDDLLQRIATVIRNTTRVNDIAARLAGDEFAIVFWDVRSDVVQKTAERLIDRITELGRSYPRCRVGASVGVAYFENPPRDVDEIMRRTDRALDQAKSEGKGRLVVWSQATDRSTVIRNGVSGELRAAAQPMVRSPGRMPPA